MCDVRKEARTISLERWMWEYLDQLKDENKSSYMRRAFKMLKESEDKSE